MTPKEEPITVEAIVTEALPNARFRAKLEGVGGVVHGIWKVGSPVAPSPSGASPGALGASRTSKPPNASASPSRQALAWATAAA